MERLLKEDVETCHAMPAVALRDQLEERCVRGAVRHVDSDACSMVQKRVRKNDARASRRGERSAVCRYVANDDVGRRRRSVLKRRDDVDAPLDGYCSRKLESALARAAPGMPGAAARASPSDEGANGNTSAAPPSR